MIIVDTSIWISFLKKDDPDIYDILKSYLKKQHVYGVTAVFGELLQGVKSKREYDIIQVIWESLPKLDERMLFIEAGKISNEHRFYAHGVGLIDCYILAACMEKNLSLWTLDKKLQKAFETITSKT